MTQKTKKQKQLKELEKFFLKKYGKLLTKAGARYLAKKELSKIKMVDEEIVHHLNESKLRVLNNEKHTKKHKKNK